MKWYKKIFLFAFLQLTVIFFTSFIGENNPEEASEPGNAVSFVFMPYESVINDYSKYILNQLDSNRTVGAAITIVSHDSVLFMQTYGVRVAGTADSVNKHTLFRLASVSKGFAGVLACLLEEDGILTLEEPVNATIPDFTFSKIDAPGSLTIKQTLNHTTGFVPHAYDDLIENGFNYPQIYNQLKTTGPAVKPGSEYAYQNAAFSLLDTVLKVKTYCDYSQWLDEKIFQPLNMRDASVGLASMQTNKNVAYPHRLINGRFQASKLNANYYNVAPAAGVNASIEDMSKWLKALLGNRTDVIDTAVLNKITTPTVETPLQKKYTYHWGKVDNKYYSLGWRVYDYMGYRIIYHGGFVNGYRAEIAFCPELNTGIAFLQNSPNKVAGISIPEFWKRYLAFDIALKNQKSTESVGINSADSLSISFLSQQVTF